MDWSALFQKPARERKALRELDLADKLVSWGTDHIWIANAKYPVTYINVARDVVDGESVMQAGDIRFAYRNNDNQWLDGIASRYKTDACIGHPAAWRWEIKFFH